MAYTIISQNNSTTTLSDGVNTITVPSRVNLTSGNFTIVEVNNNMATLEDGDGNVYRDIPCVATLAGEGGGGGSSLPDQTGHSGEFLTTDGTDASWSDKPLVNTATGTNGIGIGATSSGNSSVVIGGNDNGAGFDVIIGSGAYAQSRFATDSVVIGRNSSASGGNNTVVGNNSTASAANAIVVGRNGKATGAGAFQFGSGTNGDAHTVKFFINGQNYKLLDSDGTIPAARHAALPAADGTYTLQLVISSGVPTLSWVAV